MTSKIKYRAREGHLKSGEPPGDQPSTDLINQALETATKILDRAHIPYYVERLDQRNEGNRAATALFGFYIRMSGRGTRCGPITYGWTLDSAVQWDEDPTGWTGEHTCDTSPARDFPAAHIAATAVIDAWGKMGLVEDVDDTTGWLATLNLRKLAAVERRTTASMRRYESWMQETGLHQQSEGEDEQGN